MLKKILIVVVVLAAGLAGYVAMQPTEFNVVRSATMAASPAVVFAQVDDFHKWEAWSPWAKLDPQAKNAYDGAASGVGAGFSWDGNDQVGKGRMTITQSTPSESIRIKLEFEKPYKDSSEVLFTFKPEGDKTAVTWSMSGENDFVSKAMCLLMDMEAMVGGQFEKGLASIKAIVEATAGK